MRFIWGITMRPASFDQTAFRHTGSSTARVFRPRRAGVALVGVFPKLDITLHAAGAGVNFVLGNGLVLLGLTVTPAWAPVGGSECRRLRGPRRYALFVRRVSGARTWRDGARGRDPCRSDPDRDGCY